MPWYYPQLYPYRFNYNLLLGLGNIFAGELHKPNGRCFGRGSATATWTSQSPRSKSFTNEIVELSVGYYFFAYCFMLITFTNFHVCIIIGELLVQKLTWRYLYWITPYFKIVDTKKLISTEKHCNLIPSLS